MARIPNGETYMDHYRSNVTSNCRAWTTRRRSPRSRPLTHWSQLMYLSEIATIADPKERRATYTYFTTHNKRPDSLSSRITAQVELTETEYTSLAALLGKRCQSKTKKSLLWACEFVVGKGCSYGIYSRITFDEKGEASYCAGQCYTSEIRAMRELILS